MTRMVAVTMVALAPVWGDEPMNKDKQVALNQLRVHYSKQPERGHQLKRVESYETCLKLLDKDGQFKDLKKDDATFRKKKYGESNWSVQQKKVGSLHSVAMNRLWRIAEAFRNGAEPQNDSKSIRRRLYLGVIHYGAYELKRANVSGRFHGSCFVIPTAAINVYFCLFKEMEAAEKGQCDDPLTIKVNRILKQVGFQSWTQPFRHDETDANVVQVERFRKHVWWVGGNALAYRSVLACAAMMNSTEMIDVIATVASRGLSATSQTTYDSSFWTEGFTADGAGWGHGKQCLVWGYPLHGSGSALNILTELKGTPWAQALSRDNCEAVLNYVRGSAFYFHRGMAPPCLGRGNMTWAPDRKDIPSTKLAVDLLTNWRKSLTEAQASELREFVKESKEHTIVMTGTTPGSYTGTRYFFNNDDLIKKTEEYYVMVNMASSRVDGLESAFPRFSGYNFYTCDGLTLFQRKGDEYRKAMGAWDLTSWPGVTARQGEHNLVPITSWGGFHSKSDFCAGATHGGKNACAGFVFEKEEAARARPMSRAEKGWKEFLFGVRAHKGYFFFGDTFIALGTGIKNLTPQTEGFVWTTIDQTVQMPDLAVDGNAIPIDGKNHQIILKKSYEDHSGDQHRRVVSNNGFLYSVLNDQTPGEVRLVCDRRKTRWNTLTQANTTKQDKPDELDMFHLVIDHGPAPDNDRYGYMVGLRGGLPKDPPVVISNTPRLQAVTNSSRSVVQAIVYDVTSKIDDGNFTYELSAPCAFMAEWDGSACTITITDATMSPDLEKITAKITHKDKTSTIEVAMPQGNRCGSPATVIKKGLKRKIMSSNLSTEGAEQ